MRPSPGLSDGSAGAVRVPDSLALPLDVDLEALRRDALAIEADLWTDHFNHHAYAGRWEGVAFRAIGGDLRRLYPDLAHRRPYEDTPLLDRCPEVSRLLRQLACPLAAARFLRLGAGSKVRTHQDYDLGFAHGEIRLYVPVFRPEGVTMVVDGDSVELRPGQVWYVDTGLPHALKNPGPEAQLDLVVDCAVNPWLEDVFRQALGDPLSAVRSAPDAQCGERNK